MGTKKWADVRRDTGPEGALREASLKASMRAAMALADLREQLELRQAEVADRMGTDQGSVSRIERRGDMHLSTLREYVAALGGELELVVSFPDGTEVLLESEREVLAVG